MSNELIIKDLQPLVSVDEFSKEINTQTWLPRLQIIDPKSRYSMDKVVPAGNFALIRSQDDVDDLTDEINVVVLDMRWKALDVSNSDDPITVYDKDSEVYKAIQEKSEIKDSGCMWGAEFLVWIESVKQFATYFCSSKTSRRESTHIFKLIGHGSTLKVQLISTKKYSWYGPKISPCSAPFDIPPIEKFKEEVGKFRASITETEVVKESTTRER